MTDNVTYLDTVLDVPVDRVLQSEEALALGKVIILGWKDDVMFFASSTGDVLDINMTLDIAKKRVIESFIGE